MAGWQDGRMAGWQDGRMAGWQVAANAKCRPLRYYGWDAGVISHKLAKTPPFFVW